MDNGGDIVHITIPIHRVFLTFMAILWSGVLVLSLALIRTHVKDTDTVATRVQQLEGVNERRGQKLEDVSSRLERIERKLDQIEKWVK